VAADASGIVATLKFLEHHFAKTSHSGLPPVTHTLSLSPILLDSHYRGACGFVLVDNPSLSRFFAQERFKTPGI
jgi:hypothetical protein